MRVINIRSVLFAILISLTLGCNRGKKDDAIEVKKIPDLSAQEAANQFQKLLADGTRQLSSDITAMFAIELKKARDSAKEKKTIGGSEKLAAREREELAAMEFKPDVKADSVDVKRTDSILAPFSGEATIHVSVQAILAGKLVRPSTLTQLFRCGFVLRNGWQLAKIEAKEELGNDGEEKNSELKTYQLQPSDNFPSALVRIYKEGYSRLR